MIVVVTVVLAIVVMVLAAVGVLAVHLRRHVGQLVEAVGDAARRIEPVTEELTDEAAVFSTEIDHVRSSLERLAAERSSRDRSG